MKCQKKRRRKLRNKRKNRRLKRQKRGAKKKRSLMKLLTNSHQRQKKNRSLNRIKKNKNFNYQKLNKSLKRSLKRLRRNTTMKKRNYLNKILKRAKFKFDKIALIKSGLIRADPTMRFPTNLLAINFFQMWKKSKKLKCNKNLKLQSCQPKFRGLKRRTSV